MANDAQLARFAEWNPNPIFELNMAGEVVYANLMARTQFPDVMAQGLSHPILKDLANLLRDFQPNPQSEVIVYNHEVEFEKKCYEQQLFGFHGAIYVYMMEVTERKQLKAQAHFNDKLATMGAMAAGVAHEINNPITWMLGNLNLLKACMGSLHPHVSDKELMAKLDETVDDLLAGMQQIRAITLSLKGLGRIDKNETVSVDIHQVLNMAITMAAVEYKTHATLEKSFAKNLPLISSNPGKLHQVFLNLLINAAQAIPIGDVQHNRIYVTTSVEHDRVRIDIRDTGLGISPEILPKIFDSFFTTKGSAQGNGLGLSICQEIIRDLKGEINVDTLVGKGTCFTIFLPVQHQVIKPVAETPAVSVSNVKRKILLVDNEPILLKLMARILGKDNQITTAEGGAIAKQMIAEHGDEYDAIVTDLNMPDISGADLYNFAAEKYPGLEKKFIFVTGGVEMPWIQEFLQELDNPVLEKPFTPRDILNLIEKV